ncbi:MAG: efflux RND transporter periplasmic adaptor subunit [Acidobacteria bacterium]|nr:MAG: efflux RND transporter periplasmic adaptor subunit [Acidobacteriota bacterium]
MAESRGTGGADLSALRIDDRDRTPKGGGARWLLAAAAVVALAAVAAAALGLFRGTPVVETAAARPAGPGGAVALLNASGYITPRRRATVAAKITARVVDVYVDEGMPVGEGQILARLDDADAQRRLVAARTSRDATAAQVASLEVNLANAERELQRQRDLERDGVATVQALDQARTSAESLRAQIDAVREQVRAADAQVGVAVQDVDNCTVRAPFAGMVVSKDAQRGEMVSPVSAGGGFTRTGIATIVDMASLEIEVDVNESYIARVVPGQRVDAVLDAYPEWHIPAKVRTVIPTADRQKATVKVRISLDKLDPRILPDMGVKVSFLADEARGAKASTAVLVPNAAVRQADGRNVVFVVRDGVVERRAVSVGAAAGSNVEVTAGVAAGDEVVVSPPASLRDGERVKVR